MAKKRKTAGRPRGRPGYNRSVQISVRFTPQDLQVIFAKARSVGAHGAATWIRELVLSALK